MRCANVGGLRRESREVCMRTITMFSDTVSPQIFERGVLGIGMSSCLPGIREHLEQSSFV